MAARVMSLVSAPAAAGLPQGSDLLVVQRAAQPYRTTVEELGRVVLVPATATTIGAVRPGTNLTVAADGTLHASISGAMVFRGAIDPLVTPAPSDPSAGDVWVSQTAGEVGPGWSGLTGERVGVGDQLLWDGSRWIANAASDVVGVLTVEAAAPLSVDATDPHGPVLTIAVATAAAVGVVQLADEAALHAGTGGRVVDAAQLKVLAGQVMPLDLSTLPPLPA